MKIVVMGGRAPVGLEIIRNFAGNGHTVYLAESIKDCMSDNSHFITDSFLLPPPRFNELAFADRLIEILTLTKADILMPTCEETFYVSKNASKIINQCPWVNIIVDDFSKLDKLHNKYKFMLLAKKLGIKTPDTYLVDTNTSLGESIKKIPSKKAVLKPVYSRFGSNVSYISKDKPLKHVDYKKAKWVCQEFIDGQLVCAYSYAKKGVVRFSAVYKNDYISSSNVYSFFTPVCNPNIESSVKKIVKHLNFTGNISFDFIVKGNSATLIECNPRVTSGIHMLYDNDLAELFFGDTNDKPVLKNSQIFIPNIFDRNIIRPNYLKQLFSYRDCIARRDDLLPLVGSIKSLIYFNRLSRHKNISMLEASTYDIQWDGYMDT